MTSAQKAFLDANPEYQPIGQVGGTAYFTRQGTLKADGTFVRATRAAPVSTADGAFGVGVKVIRQPGEVGGSADPRIDFTPRDPNR